MNTKTFTAHTYECDSCGWLVAMEYERGGLGAYVTNAALKALRAVANQELGEADKIVTICNTCGASATKAVA